MPDFDGIDTALAARFAAAAVTPPTSYENIRISTADLPGQMTPLPTVLVYTESGTFDTRVGDRQSMHQRTIRFYYNQTGDIEKDMKALRLWLAVLCDQLRASVQLGGALNITRCTVDSYKVGVMPYAGLSYTGIEIGVSFGIAEGWSSTA